MNYPRFLIRRLVGLATLCCFAWAGCASPQTADADKASPAPTTPKEAPSAESELFAYVEKYAPLMPADARIAAVLLAGESQAPTFVDRLVGVAPAATDEGLAADAPPLSEIRSDIAELFDTQLGFRPTGVDAMVLAIGPSHPVLVVEGEVDYARPPTSETIDGVELTRVEADADGFGPWWGVELDDQTTAFFLLQRHALAAAKTDLAAPPADSLATSERLASFRDLFAGGDGDFGLVASLDTKRLQKIFEHFVFDPLDVSTDEPDHFALFAGDTLRFTFWGSRATIAEIERDIDDKVDDVRENIYETRTQRLDRLPLFAAATGLVVGEVLDSYLALLEPELTTEALSYELPLDGVDSERAVAGLLGLHGPYLANIMVDEANYSEPLEAEGWVAQIGEDAIDYFEAKIDGKQRCTFPPSVRIPAKDDCCPGVEDDESHYPVCQMPKDAWAVDWLTRRANPEAAQHFVYEVESNQKAGADARMTVRARADFNCDGHAKHTLELTLRGEIAENGNCFVDVDDFRIRGAIEVRNAYD